MRKLATQKIHKINSPGCAFVPYKETPDIMHKIFRADEHAHLELESRFNRLIASSFRKGLPYE